MSDDGKLVPFDRGRRRPDPARVREFAATARKLQLERESSAELVDQILRATPMSDWPRLAENESLRNSGALERLGQEVATRLERDPREALVLANLATTIAETLPPDAYPRVVIAQVRAHAWKDRGQTLCYLARYSEALDALDRAEEQLAPFGTLAHDRAIVRFVRAITLQKVGRFSESQALLTECRAVFRDHDDSRRVLSCGIAEGALRYRLSDFRGTCEVLSPLLSFAREQDDRESEARILNNLGFAEVCLGALPSAREHLQRSLDLFASLGRHSEALRAQWNYGTLLSKAGELADGMRHLRAVRRQFLATAMVEEAGLCGLDIVEVLLSRGDANRAAELAQTIIREFTAAGLNTRAIAALGLVREAAATRDAAAAQTAARVRHYIRSLRTEPQQEFNAC
ncbi:MAG TPA: tetratricopeptide repeat protein [Thermoanaerobaculia bacterium]|nr:tetratricopeptide repeat protein [Thermoanaerobaculia bacterium]